MSVLSSPLPFTFIPIWTNDFCPRHSLSFSISVCITCSIVSLLCLALFSSINIGREFNENTLNLFTRNSNRRKRRHWFPLLRYSSGSAEENRFLGVRMYRGEEKRAIFKIIDRCRSREFSPIVSSIFVERLKNFFFVKFYFFDKRETLIPTVCDFAESTNICI